MNPIQSTATAAIGLEAAPRLKGPLWKLEGYRRPMRMGRPYDMYKPMVAMDVAAENATDDPRDGRARRKESVTASQMVRIGDWNWASTSVKKWGRPGIT